MLYINGVKKIYEQIQKKLLYMIPEKWDRLYLYASVSEQMEDFLSGEMYFYYFPKGIFRKNPINVYEIPVKFNISEESYSGHIQELYDDIKRLWNIFLSVKHKQWHSITISIKNTKFKIEYNYEDISISDYSATQRHIIWKYKHLNQDIDSYNRKERRVIENYLSNETEEDVEIYEEGIYKTTVRKIIDYEKEENKFDNITEEIKVEEKTILNNQILNKKLF